VAGENGIPVIEDAACALGSEQLFNGALERVGRPRGVLACFSFHPRKVITTGDGGMLTTSDPALADRVRLLRQHAMTIPDTIRSRSEDLVFEQYLEPARNFRLTDLQAAVGRPQLARLAEIVTERRRLAEIYRERLAGSRVFAPVVEPRFARCNWQSFPLVLRDAAPDQGAVLRTLLGRGVAAKRGVHNAHQEPAYADRRRWTCGHRGCAGACPHLPHSEWARDRIILIPLFHGMTLEEQEQVLAALEAVEPR
jgi:dTDP-4-amino-4,6-dideoxygalactose transaminase